MITSPMKAIYIFDPATVNRRNWCNLEEAEATPPPQDLGNDETGDLTHDGAARRAVPPHNEFVCIIHFTRLNFGDSTVRAWATKYPNARFIAISGSPLKRPENMPTHVLYYRSAVGQDLSATPFRGRFIEWYRQWSSNLSAPWGPLDCDMTPLHALRLLCEAWLLSSWPERPEHPCINELKAALQIEEEKPNCQGGITLTAPKTRTEWLAAFAACEPDMDPLQAILNNLPTPDAIAAVREFFDEAKEEWSKFPQVADLFLKLDAIVKASN